MQGVGVSVPEKPRDELTVLVGRNIVLARKLARISQGVLLRRQEQVIPRDPKTGEPRERAFVLAELSGWENGWHRPGDRNLRRIAAITGQTFGWFSDPHDDLEV